MVCRVGQRVGPVPNPLLRRPFGSPIPLTSRRTHAVRSRDGHRARRVAARSGLQRCGRTLLALFTNGCYQLPEHSGSLRVALDTLSLALRPSLVLAIAVRAAGFLRSSTALGRVSAKGHILPEARRVSSDEALATVVTPGTAPRRPGTLRAVDLGRQREYQ
jgi:hypothetical protein